MRASFVPAALELLESLLNGYSAVYFSNKKGAGLLFMAVTFVWPIEGLEAMFCALVGILFARLMGFDRALIRLGLYTYNPLLVGLALAHHLPLNFQLILLLMLSGMMTTLISSGLKSVFEGVFALPQLSLAFVLVTVSVFNATGSPGPIVHALPEWGNPFSLPGPVEHFLKSLAAVFSRNDWAAGLLAFLGILYTSRISAALAIIGYATGSYFYGLDPANAGVDFAGYNFVVSAIAIGGIYAVPSPSSYCIAALAAALCAPVALWVAAWLKPFGTDVLSFPFLLITYAFIAGLRVRPANAEPELVLFPAISPEENLAIAHSRRLRQKDAPQTGLRLPFIGAWHVTQGINGEFTHKDKWRYAIDFSLPDEEPRFKPERNKLFAYSAFGLPVTAPLYGVVTRIVDGQPDNDPGYMDPEHNWGNYISLQHLDGSYSLVAHLKKGSIRVKPGDRVNAGEVMALCGNSGRSPTPHIHYHLQRVPEPGSETLPFHFSSYIKLNGNPTLIERSLPQKGEVVENLVVSPAIKTAFDFITGTFHRFQVETNRGRRLETLVSRMDISGWRYLESLRDHSRLYFHLTEDMLYMNYCSAKPGSLLFALLLAVSKVPLVETNGLSWSDELPLNSFFRGLPRLGAEFILPFIPGYGVKVKRHFFERAVPGGVAHETQAKIKVVGIETAIAAPFAWSFGDIHAQALFCEGIGPLKISVASETPILNLIAKKVDA